MKSTLYIITILFSIAIQAQKASEITWNENEKLTIDDFQGSKPGGTFQESYLAYRIEITPEEMLVNEADEMYHYKDVSLVTLMDKDKSWIDNKTPSQLQFEQLHFDIAELFARKMRQRFRELQIQKEKRFTVYSQVYKALFKECRAFQKTFNRETFFGAEKFKLGEWQNRIETELDMLKQYKI